MTRDMFQKYTLPNKTRVLMVPHADTKAITLLALFHVGSRYEPAKILGISHFLEHMMFKGTKKRPETIEISRELDGVGAEYNAFTGKDHTGYYIKVNYEHAALAIDMMYDMLANSLVQTEEVRKERNVIMEEIHMYEDNPIMLVEELFEEELYRGSSLASRIAGDKKSLDNIKRKQIVDFRHDFYRPEDTVFVASGKIPSEMTKLIEDTFGKARARDGKAKAPRVFKPAAIHSRGPRIALKFRDTTQVQLVLGFPAYEYLNPKLSALQLLSTILGGTMSSRLFIEVREKRGLAYSVRSGVNVYEDVGNVYVQAGLDKSRTEEAIKVIMDELRKMSKKGVTAEELDRAKENIRGRMVLALEDSEATADFFGKQELHTSKVQTPEEKLEKILAVTREEVQAVAKDLFKPSKLAAAIIGPFEEAKRFAKLMRF